MKTSKFIIAIASIAALFAAVSPAVAADKAGDGKQFSSLYMSPVNAASQAAMVDTIKANLAAKKGACTDLMAKTVEVPGEYVRGMSQVRCETAPKGALFFGSSLQLVDGKPARIPFIHYVTEDKSVDVLAANSR